MTAPKSLRIAAAIVGGPIVYIVATLLVGLVTQHIDVSGLGLYTKRVLGGVSFAVPFFALASFLWWLKVIDREQLLSRKPVNPLAIFVVVLSFAILLLMAFLGAKEAN